MSDAELAVDAELFDAVEAQRTGDWLRFWECRPVTVIVGRSGIIDREVHEARCARDGVPIVRRMSGGGAVIVGPGCLNYSLVLSLDRWPELQQVTSSYKIILGRIINALDLTRLSMRGVGDLALDERKVSGSAQRRGRHAVLHHGTFLCDFDTRLLDCYLKKPPSEPPYRRGRGHSDFVTNLPLAAETIRARLARAFPSTMVLH